MGPAVQPTQGLRLCMRQHRTGAGDRQTRRSGGRRRHPAEGAPWRHQTGKPDVPDPPCAPGEHGPPTRLQPERGHAEGPGSQRRALPARDPGGHRNDRPRPPDCPRWLKRSSARREAPAGHHARGSKASRTTSAKRLAASTSTNMKMKAAIRLHHTIGSRANSMRAALIIVPKLTVFGSTPIPT